MYSQLDEQAMAKPHTSDAQPIQANALNRYEVSPDALPLHCPMGGMSLWNSHPRVYLPIEESGEARCPYCGAIYVLKRDE